MENVSDLAGRRMRQLGEASNGSTPTDQIHRDSSCRDSSSVETPAASNQWNETNLPEWLWPFVQNRSWAIRFANLLNQGYRAQLQNLVEHIPRVAHTNPVHMMAVACSKARWADTLEQIKERLSVERLASEVQQRLQTKKEQAKAIYAAVWRLKGHVMRYAATAQEVGRDRFKFFCWLTSEANLARERAYYSRPS